MEPLIAIDRLTFVYPAEETPRPALQDVSLELFQGEFVAILGANGSGKTTLARQLNALLLPTSGKVVVSGLDTRERKNHGKIRQWVGMVFQHPEEQIVATTVEEDVAFGPENLGLPAQEIRRRVDQAIAAVGLEAHRQRPPHLLSAGQMQRLALAGVLAMRPRCVVFDEATTMLDPAGRRMAMELMNELRSDGLTVCFVTHNMEEAVLADRVIVLERGKLAYEGSPKGAFDSARLAEWGLGLPPAAVLARSLSGCLPGLPADILSVDDLLANLPARGGDSHLEHPLAREYVSPPSDPLVEVRGLEHTYLAGTPLAHLALSGVDMAVEKGRSHGLIGVTGSGKSTLLQHLNGLLRPQKGSVRVGPFQLEDPQVLTRDVTRIAGLVMQNPEMQFFEQYVGDEIAYGPRQMKAPGPLAERVRWAMDLVGLDFDAFKDRFTFTLSGGEKRKVALASILAIRPEILLLDEPTAGLDPISHGEVLRSLGTLQEQGMTMIVSSHRMDDVADLVEDLTAFRKGQSVLSGAAGEVFGQFARLEEIGLEPPTAARVAEGLRRQGWDLPEGIVRTSQLVEAISGCREAEV